MVTEKYVVLNFKYHLHLFGEGGLLIDRFSGEVISKLNPLASEILFYCNGKFKVKDIYFKVCADLALDSISDMYDMYVKFIDKLVNKKMIELYNEPYAFNSSRYKEINVSGEKGKFYPFQIILELTNKCNLNCKHCYKIAGVNKRKFLKEDLIYEIAECVRGKSKQITLTGGEATLHPGINNIIKRLSKDFKVFLLSNGIEIMNIEEENLRLLSYVQISVYGTNEEEYELVTGEKIKFSLVITAIAKIVELNINHKVVIMVNNKTIESLERCIIALKNVGVRVIECNYPVTYGRGYFVRSDVTTISEANLKRMCVIVNKYNNSKFSLKCTGESEKEAQENKKVNCDAGAIVLVVNQEGRVRPCTLVPETLFNMCEAKEYFDAIANDDFRDLLKKQHDRISKKINENKNLDFKKEGFCQGIFYNHLFEEISL